jgi:hypothetical protein
VVGEFGIGFLMSRDTNVIHAMMMALGIVHFTKFFTRSLRKQIALTLRTETQQLNWLQVRTQKNNGTWDVFYKA